MSVQRLSTDDLRAIIKRRGFSVKILAVSVGLDVRTLERRFHNQYRTTPKHWIMLERMKCAPPLLADGLLNKQVAAALGYTCESNFCRAFKRYYGCGPQQFAHDSRVVST
jgi:transcriptional regulator GlxA family with amidase domain